MGFANSFESTVAVFLCIAVAIRRGKSARRQAVTDWAVLQWCAIIGESLVTRKIVGDVKPCHAFGVEDVRCRNEGNRIVKSAEVEFDNRAQFTTIALP